MASVGSTGRIPKIWPVLYNTSVWTAAAAQGGVGGGTYECTYNTMVPSRRTDTCTVYICMCTQHVYKDKLYSCESDSVATPEVHIPIAGAYRVLYHEYTSLVITKLLYS